uniref:Secreted protein n=1 Tax=Panagrellus redivivus TaxID=6233 RepID=A0A7E4VVF4_PANRE
MFCNASCWLMAALVKRWNAKMVFLWSEGSPVWLVLERPGREAGDYTLLWKADAATTIPQPGTTQSTIGWVFLPRFNLPKFEDPTRNRLQFRWRI